MNLLVIGGVAAGTKVAAKAKRVMPDAKVTIVTKGKDISYAGCGLPYYVGELIEGKDQLIVNTPAKFSALTGALVQTEREVTRLDVKEKKAVVRNLRTGGEEIYTYGCRRRIYRSGGCRKPSRAGSKRDGNGYGAPDYAGF